MLLFYQQHDKFKFSNDQVNDRQDVTLVLLNVYSLEFSKLINKLTTCATSYKHFKTNCQDANKGKHITSAEVG